MDLLSFFSLSRSILSAKPLYVTLRMALIGVDGSRRAVD